MAVHTFHIKLLFLRVARSQAASPECSEIHKRIWVFPEACWLSTCPTSACRITWWFKKFGNIVGDSWKRRNWKKVGVKNHCNQYLYLTFSGEAKESLDDSNYLKSLTHHAAGVGICAQSGMSIPSYPSSVVHLGKFIDNTEFKSFLEGEESHARSAPDQGNRSRQIAGWLQHSIIHTG